MSEAWWQAAFGCDYLTLYAHRSDAQAATEVAGVLPRLRQAEPVLDACCGAGRHLQALRQAGVRAHGFDWSPELLACGQRERAELTGHLLRADLRRLPLRGGWGAITLFFTAFGYFDDETNARVLVDLATLLQPGGWLMLDLPEVDRLVAGLVPHSEREIDGRRLLERRYLIGSRVEKTVSIFRNQVLETEYTESVRLYHPEQMIELATQAGCTVEECWPSLQGPDQAGDRAVYWLRKQP